MQQNFFLNDQQRYFLPATGWIILCTVLLTLPQSAFPGKSWLTYIPWLDKWVHLGLFSIMAVLLCWGYFKTRNLTGALKKTFIGIGVLCLLYGIAMEFVQKYWVPNRSFDPGDVIADGAGAAAGVLLSLKRYIKK